MRKSEQVAQLLKSIETGQKEPIGYINPENYVQHNQHASDGLEGFATLLSGLSTYPSPPKVDVVRLFTDGDYVVAHTSYNFYGPKIAFDIFRFEDDKIVEHWDNMQPTPQQLNPSLRSMIDGTDQIEDLDKTFENKLLVEKFFTDVMINGKREQMMDYFDGDNYIQHNPNIGDGLSGLGRAMKWMQENNYVMSFTKLHKVLGRGNFVLTVSEGLYGEGSGVATAFYDLFRVVEGKIAEHWDVVEPIVSDDDSKNSNGKFNF